MTSRVAARTTTSSTVLITINGDEHTMHVDNRTTLLDLLRERLDLTGTKKGCDHGQCGACTVLVEGRRANSCLIFAVAMHGRSVTTIESFAEGELLHPMQQAFIDHDGFQCGYCTPGQICSAIAMLQEVAAGWPSAVTTDLNAQQPMLDEAEIRERMSGNLCRCGAYVHIVSAISDIARTERVLADVPLPSDPGMSDPDRSDPDRSDPDRSDSGASESGMPESGAA